MQQWIPFKEGKYDIEAAWLVNSTLMAIPVTAPQIEIYRDAQDIRQLKGNGLIRPYYLVAMLEDDDRIDLLLDLDGEVVYRLDQPSLKSGKAFAPDVQATLHFAPMQPWQLVAPEALKALRSGLKVIQGA